MIISKQPINMGRQKEFDYCKGLFMFAIFFIHAFQATMSDTDSSVFEIIYMIATMVGAPVFIFVMGMGTVYSSKCTSKTMVKDGVKLIAYQYLQNLSFVTALSIPYVIYVLMNKGESYREAYTSITVLYLQYINIFFLAGGIYLILALLRALHLPWFGYIILAVLSVIVAPFFYNATSPFLPYVCNLFTGGPAYVSFAVVYYLGYASLGVAFGHLWRYVADKKKMYQYIMSLSFVIMTIWWIYVFNASNFDIKTMYSLVGVTYIRPTLFRMAAEMAHMLFLAGLFYLLQEKIEKCRVFSEVLLNYCRHISKYYAIHISFYLFAFGLNGYKGFSFGGCVLLMLLDMIYTELLVRGWNKWYEK